MATGFVNSDEGLVGVNAELQALLEQPVLMTPADLRRPEYFSYVLNILNTQLLWPTSKAKKQPSQVVRRHFSASCRYEVHY